MPNIGPVEIIIVLVIVLLIFGPKRLPDLGRSLGRGMREFKDSVTGKDDDKQLEEQNAEQAAPVAPYAAILVSMPIILYELYAFVLPAFSPTERRVATPLLLMVPFLFIAGVAFAYFVVMPAALQFLLHFNQHQFNLQVRARDYY